MTSLTVTEGGWELMFLRACSETPSHHCLESSNFPYEVDERVHVEKYPYLLLVLQIANLV